MIKVVLKLKAKPTVPLDLRAVKPENFAGKSLESVLAMKVLEGGREAALRDLFEVEAPQLMPSNPDDIEVVLGGGGTEKIRYLGYKMEKGKITVEGNVGPLAGYKMRGGTLVVKGSAGSWLGAKMKGGIIEVFGNAGDFVGAKLYGERAGKGMRGGTILIHGDAGSFLGLGMSGGTIIVEGNAGLMPGGHMTGGTLVIQGACGDFPGARMSAGRVVVLGKAGRILPSFYVDSLVESVRVRGKVYERRCIVFVGDVLVGGRGSVVVGFDENAEALKPLLELLVVEGDTL